ncbi:glycosyltransferase family 2 protein [Mycetocola sp. 2940]|uniref:glycosyltransferase family 2 protein n=1 Tax=Mycetocola sp. 2940 TaxID=3156452 RepID=UPI003394B998
MTKLVMTLMVRDEIDIVGAMLDHHLRQGVDVVIVTDNGSVDGTAELLADYAARGLVDLRHDPVQKKQQGTTVTEMARDAYRLHSANWVINADADEFWVATDRKKTLKQAFELIPESVGSFDVPVFDMIGEPALDGTGLNRLIYKDLRSEARLLEIGLLSHSTQNAAHIGSPDVTVSQGNHFVDIASGGTPDAAAGIEVLHFPWRSWAQYARKVENAGRSYENSDLTPSPNHHGMRDYRRFQEGSLFALYAARHPAGDELRAGIEAGTLVLDTTIADSVESPVRDVPIEPALLDSSRDLGEVIARLQNQVNATTIERDTFSYELGVARLELEQRRERNATLEARIAKLRDKVADTDDQLERLRSRRVLRLADGLSAAMRKALRR